GLSAEFAIVTDGGIFQLRDDEVTIGDNEGIDTLIGIETLRFGDGSTVGITSPLILDLNGNGVETLSASESEAAFDLDGDGVGDDTSWIGTGDGFLFVDRDGNGTVSNAGELSFIDDRPNASTDLVGLAAFDSDGDGFLTSGDERFGEFGVWQDANGDGIVVQSEVSTLASSGIVSISLTGEATNAAYSLGEVAIANTGSFTFADGRSGVFADAALTYTRGADTGLRTRRTADFTYERASLDGGRPNLAELFDLLRLQYDVPMELLIERMGGADARAPLTPTASGSFVERWRRPIMEDIDVEEFAERTGERVELRGSRHPLDPVEALHDLPFDGFDRSPSLAAKVATMRQDMAAFGAESGVERMRDRRDFGLALTDFFV
ncbi:MAG: hypothetical protein AAFY47_10630, partial [Pseudomonadota bacterium]